MTVLLDSIARHGISAAIESIDLTDWLFSLADAEYQACAQGHIAAGTTRARDGRRMSINVERVGSSLMVQHYVEDVSRRDHCRVVSLTDSFMGASASKFEVVWELTLHATAPAACELANRVVVRSTPEFEAALAARSMRVEDVRPQMQASAELHNAEETPLFAADIERKAKAGAWR